VPAVTTEKLRYVVARCRGLLCPPITVRPAPVAEVVFERNVAVSVRDGTVLRVNVFRPDREGAHPAILCAHPYGKDNLPTPRRGGGFKVAKQYRVLRMPEPVSFSAWTGWEAPDPAYWVPRGYAVVNCDLRGCGSSEGIGDLLSPAESDDYHDLIEWAAAQPWCTGKVGLNGVSYLALSQYGAAATQPPSLVAICPWEGFSDPYRDLLFPGGVREDGFVKLWAKGLKGDRLAYDLRQEQLKRPLRDAVWASRAPDLSKVEVPILICGSFSDNNLHSRGSIRAFEEVGSKQRWLYTHRGGKWCTYYSSRALEAQERFFDHFLKGIDNGMDSEPPVRLEVREDRDTIHSVRQEEAWPPPAVQWTELFLGADRRLTEEPPSAPEDVGFATGKERATWAWRVPRDLELSGPMALRLRVSLDGATDANLFAGVEKWRNGRFVPFEGSYGFGFDRVTTGWTKLSHREPDPEISRPFAPVNRDDWPRPLAPGEVAEIEFALGPSATFFRAGEEVRLVLGGRWLHPRDPLIGQFPAAYEASPDCTVCLHCGGEPAPRLLVPVIA
jgi:predicted acyl esterase